jgi:hypothetical protein
MPIPTPKPIKDFDKFIDHCINTDYIDKIQGRMEAINTMIKKLESQN